MKPLLSVVVPTKNRYEYLTFFIDLFTSIAADNIELVLQDNSEEQNSAFLEKLKLIKDNRIKYFYNESHISVVENCDLALLNCSGDYITMLGDDDGFLPELIEWVKLLDKKQFDVLLPEKANYSWPDIVNRSHNFSGFLSFSKINNTLVEIDSYKEMLKCLHYGGTFMFKMPRVYHAVVSKKILNRVYETTGSYFPGPSPDIANAIALSIQLPRVLYINRPLIISGKGYKSTGGQGLRHAHIGKIEDIKHLPRNTALNWETNLPKIWTGQTIYAETILKSLKACKRLDLVSEFNFLRNYANFTGKHFGLFRLVTPHIKWFQYPHFLYYVLCFILLRGNIFIGNLLKNRFKKNRNQVALKDISNIVECVVSLEREIV